MIFLLQNDRERERKIEDRKRERKTFKNNILLYKQGYGTKIFRDKIKKIKIKISRKFKSEMIIRKQKHNNICL